MAAPNTIRSGVGFRWCQVLAMNATGYPAATDTSEYAGLRISGARSLTINDPEPQQIIHLGDDRPFALDVLPPTEPITGELTVSKINDVVDAILTDDVSVTVGETKVFGIGTDNRGDENQVILLAYRQTLDTDPASSAYGSRRWEFRLFPKVFVIPREGGLVEAPEERMYTVRPQFVKQYPWGVSFAVGTEGFEQAQGFRGISEFKPRLVAFQASTTAAETFTFSTDFPAQATGKISVWNDGTNWTGTATLATATFALEPATATAFIVVFYEYA